MPGAILYLRLRLDGGEIMVRAAFCRIWRKTGIDMIKRIGPGVPVSGPRGLSVPLWAPRPRWGCPRRLKPGRAAA
jgi:hypothetical protein